MKYPFSKISFDTALKVAAMYQDSIEPAVVRLFFVHPDIFNFAFQMVRSEMGRIATWDALRVPSDAIRHGQLTLLAIPEPDGTFALISLDEDGSRPSGDKKSIVSYASDNAETNKGIGYFVTGERLYVDKRFCPDMPLANEMARIIACVAFTMSLINQPRMVTSGPVMSRQRRRAYERDGIRADRWSMVQWDVSKASGAAHSKATGGREGVALHWRRAHWRQAEPHWKGAQQRTDAIRPEERDRWWQWIEGMWVGHPAYGFIDSVHAPNLSVADMFARGGRNDT